MAETGANAVERDGRRWTEARSAFERLLTESGRDPLRAAFIIRSLRALADVARYASRESLTASVGAASDVETLVASLTDSAVLSAHLPKPDPLAKARLRGALMRRALLAEHGGTWTVAEVAQFLGISRQAVDKRRKTGKLLAVQVGRSDHAYPVWQFGAEGTPIAGLDSVLRCLSVEDSWTRLTFFLTKDSRLDGRTPLEALAAGDIAAVCKAATAYGEHGAP